MSKILVFMLLYVCIYGGLVAQTTEITIRALAKDAKFIGTGIGGAYVVVKDHYTQEVLAKGYTTGTSGNTDVVVKNPRERYDRITDEKTATIVAVLAIKEPTLLDIEAIAPFKRRHAAIRSSTQLWAIPGKDIAGDGVVLEIPGYIVDILSPTTHQVVASNSEPLTLRTNVVMMCGCTVQDGGIWNSRNYEVEATVWKDGIKVATIDLIKVAEDNVFEAKIPIKDAGNYEIIVTAFDNKAYNTGVDRINFVVK